MEFSILRKHAHSNCETNLFEVFKLIGKHKKKLFVILTLPFFRSCVNGNTKKNFPSMSDKLTFRPPIKKSSIFLSIQPQMEILKKSLVCNWKRYNAVSSMHNRIEEMAIPGDGVFIMKGCEKEDQWTKISKEKVFLLIMHWFQGISARLNRLLSCYL